MNITCHIQSKAIGLAITAIMISLLTSCATTQTNNETPKDEQNVEVSQSNEFENSALKPQLQSDLLEENTNLAKFENNGLKLLYPSEWSLFDVTNKAYEMDRVTLAKYEIKQSNEDMNFRVVVQIADDIPDGGYEKRKDEANLFFEKSPNIDKITFADIKINGNDFYKIDVPIGDNIQETILATIKNNKRYDIYADFDKMNQVEVLLIEEILNSIEIVD